MGPAILIMAFTSLLCFVIVYKLVKARQASHWPSVDGVILKSGTRAPLEGDSDGGDAKTLAALKYQYDVAGRTYHSTKIRAGDRFGIMPGPEILSRFPKAARVPVYYNPSRPDESVLITGLPYSVPGAWAGAAVTFMAGVGLSLIFLNVDKEMEALRRIFPPGAEPHVAIFFGLCWLWVIFMIWDNWRQANRAKQWPTVEGVVVTSRTDSHRAHAGSANQGPLVTMYEPLVVYSYVVDEIEYSSSRVNFGAEVSTKSRAPAEQRAGRYPVGAKVPVHYNPEHPTVAVLETQVAFQGMTVVFAVIFLGLTVFFSGIRL